MSLQQELMGTRLVPIVSFYLPIMLSTFACPVTTAGSHGHPPGSYPEYLPAYMGYLLLSCLHALYLLQVLMGTRLVPIVSIHLPIMSSTLACLVPIAGSHGHPPGSYREYLRASSFACRSFSWTG